MSATSAAPLIDAHTHLPSEDWNGLTPWIPTVDGAVAYLKAAGTDAALFTLWQGIFAESEADLDRSNSQALELAARSGGFLYPGVSIHPAFPAASRRWLAQFRARGLLWVGELAPYRKPYRFTEPAFLDLAETCAAGGHILQLHNHDDVAEIARRFPAMPVVCSHIQEALCRRLAPLPNAWLDISGSAGGLKLGALEEALALLGPDRLLYGTDFTVYEPRCFQTQLLKAVPDPDDRDKIRSGNLLRLLAQAGSRWPFG